MRRLGSTMAVLILMASIAEAKLEIRAIQAVAGVLGPERTTDTYYPHDQVVFRFQIVGLVADKTGRVQGKITVQVKGDDGVALIGGESLVDAIRVLGGNSVPAYATATLGDDTPPGSYTLTVVIADEHSDDTASFRRKLTVQPTVLAVIAPSFSYDEEELVPAPAGGLVGQSLNIWLTLIGFDRSQGRYDIGATLYFLDESGKPTTDQPVELSIKSENPGEVKKTRAIRVHHSVNLDREGKFTLKVGLHDKIADKTVTFEAPLNVTRP